MTLSSNPHAGTSALYLALALALLVPDTHARAGTPWWCTCRGEAKRFIASSRICEHAIEDRTGVKIKQCSRTQFLSWNRSACRLAGCTPRQ